MEVDEQGYRLNVGIILANEEGHLLWGRRLGQTAWQFPQGGVDGNESAEQAMYRELQEEIGLDPEDVQLLGVTKEWLRYRLPKHFIRRHSKPTVVGQKQKWFLLRLLAKPQKVRLDLSKSPEFDSWQWVDYWYPAEQVIYFKRQVYRLALRELESLLFPEKY